MFWCEGTIQAMETTIKCCICALIVDLYLAYNDRVVDIGERLEKDVAGRCCIRKELETKQLGRLTGFLAVELLLATSVIAFRAIFGDGLHWAGDTIFLLGHWGSNIILRRLISAVICNVYKVQMSGRLSSTPLRRLEADFVCYQLADFYLVQNEDQCSFWLLLAEQSAFFVECLLGPACCRRFTEVTHLVCVNVCLRYVFLHFEECIGLQK
uniref:Uncharacterized protein n=1 Tax=Parascaris univalens TaxID=6257 RepID=A0A915A124_PARUN